MILYYSARFHLIIINSFRVIGRGHFPPPTPPPARCATLKKPRRNRVYTFSVISDFRQSSSTRCTFKTSNGLSLPQVRSTPRLEHAVYDKSVNQIIVDHMHSRRDLKTHFLLFTSLELVSKMFSRILY